MIDANTFKGIKIGIASPGTISNNIIAKAGNLGIYNLVLSRY